MEITDEQMTPNEFRRYVIEPVDKALNKNSIPTKKLTRTTRRRVAKKMERYDT